MPTESAEWEKLFKDFRRRYPEVAKAMETLHLTMEEYLGVLQAMNQPVGASSNVTTPVTS